MHNLDLPADHAVEHERFLDTMQMRPDARPQAAVARRQTAAHVLARSRHGWGPRHC